MKMKKNVSSKYPTAVNKAGAPKEYIGIVFNGDVQVYRKATLKALKKEKGKESEKLIKEVKAAEGDLEISKLLIEADRYDILIDVFNATDCRTAIFDYIANKYQSVADRQRTMMEKHVEKMVRIVETYGKDADSERLLEEIDRQIDQDTCEALEELKILHEDTASQVFTKYHDALVAKLEELRKMQKEFELMQEDLEEMMNQTD